MLSGEAFLNPVQADNTLRTPSELVRKFVESELKAQEQDHSRWRYRLRREGPGGTQVQEIIETKEGPLELLLSLNGQPLTVEQRQKENTRIQNLVNHPDGQRQEQQKRQEDVERVIRMLKLLPDAFLFEYDGKERTLIRLKFKPNPDFHPPSREAQVFHNLEGSMWVDGKQKRLARIVAHLMNDVKFGGGLLGHLEKGGKFTLRRTEVAPGHWKIAHMHIEMKGKAVLFKTISVQEEEYLTDFRRIPSNLTLQQAAEILKKQNIALWRRRLRRK